MNKQELIAAAKRLHTAAQVYLTGAPNPSVVTYETDGVDTGFARAMAMACMDRARTYRFMARVAQS